MPRADCSSNTIRDSISRVAPSLRGPRFAPALGVRAFSPPPSPRALEHNRWSRCACGRGRGFARMVLLTDRGPSGYLPDVWASLKASAAANPDVPTVLILVALDVDALAACTILMVRGLGPRMVPAAAHMRSTQRCPATASALTCSPTPCAPAPAAAVGS